MFVHLSEVMVSQTQVRLEMMVTLQMEMAEVQHDKLKPTGAVQELQVSDTNEATELSIQVKLVMITTI